MAGGRQPLKRRDPRQEEQRRRRAEMLERQKARRAALTAHSRQLAAPAGMPSVLAPSGLEIVAHSGVLVGTLGCVAGPSTEVVANENDMLCEPSSSNDVLSTGRGGFGSRRHVGREGALTAAEWMVDVPLDLGSSWSVLARPSGVRCLIRSGGGETVRHSKGGATRRFPSALPGGSRARRTNGGCELDCIWVEPSHTYYVLDIMRWNGLRLVDLPYDNRAFFLASRLAEARAGETASTNPCRFVHVPSQPCSSLALQAAYMASGLPYRRDGLLFYHREGLYEPGPNPLVLLWADGHCSERFFDYGTEKMKEALAAEPDKAARWRADEVDAAHDIATLLAVCEGVMDTGEEMSPAM